MTRVIKVRKRIWLFLECRARSNDSESVGSCEWFKWCRSQTAFESFAMSVFFGCKNLSHVTFGMCSSLKLIGNGAFHYFSMREIRIPEGVEEISEGCVRNCGFLSRVTFDREVGIPLSWRRRDSYAERCGSGSLRYRHPGR